MIVLVTNPRSRREQLFTEAVSRRGLAPPHVVPWRAFLHDERCLTDLPFERAVLRIDSPGRDYEVERALLKRGADYVGPHGCVRMTVAAADTLREERGLILPPRQLHLGFVHALTRLRAALDDRPGWHAPSPPEAIATCFDKRLVWRRCRQLGLPVPEALDSEQPRNLAALATAMRARGWERAFVKVSCTSSASCLALLSIRREPQALTTVEMTDGKMYNSRRLRQVGGRQLETLVAFLLGEGAQVERAVPKARVHAAEGGTLELDCRVLVIDGDASFVVVRQSRHPITNLHLGGARGDPTALKRECAPGAFESMQRDAARLASELGALHVGVDVMFEPGLAQHRILEANAFGDLLPNVLRGGLDAYDTQLLALAPHLARSGRP